MKFCKTETHGIVKTARRIDGLLYAVEVSIPLERFKDKTQDEKRAIVNEAIEAEVKRLDDNREKYKGWEGSFEHYRYRALGS